MFRIIVILESTIYVYNYQTLTQEFKFDTAPNPQGICALNGSKEMTVFACLDREVGKIKIIHFDKNNETFQITAHKSAVTSICLNMDGSLVATASANGQVIRIFKADIKDHHQV
jgi:WD40 repeat protein